MLGVLMSFVLLASGPGAFVPKDGDAYSRLVAQAETEDPATDFKALRLAWMDSAAKKRADTFAMREQLGKAVQKRDLDRVAELARGILAKEYVNLQAHTLLQQVCEIRKDDACANHEAYVLKGLLDSITGSGDGKSAKTAFLVISIEEEYFVMGEKDLRVSQQALVMQDQKPFDVLSASGPGGAQDVWFDISLFFGKEFGF